MLATYLVFLPQSFKNRMHMSRDSKNPLNDRVGFVNHQIASLIETKRQ